MISVPSKEQMEAVLVILNANGFNISSPWDGDIDDLEKERFNAVEMAVGAALRIEREHHS